LRARLSAPLALVRAPLRVLAVASLVCGLGAVCVPTAGAQGVDVTCQLALTRLEPTTTNALLLDTDAVYWVVTYNAVPGTRLRISGVFPHSRYISFNAYDPIARPVDSLSDYQIAPDAGSSNPFLPGADRTVSHRSYTAFVDFGAPPAHRARNTIYTGRTTTGTPNFSGQLWYRVYMPDRGRDIMGGVGLPTIDLETQNGNGVPQSVCQNAQLPTFPAIQTALAASNGGPLPNLAKYPGKNPPQWTLFVNAFQSGQQILLSGQHFPAGQGPGFYSNRDIAYVFAPTSRGFGQLIVIHARAPTFPNTRPPSRTMPGGKQTRYFSFCQYDPLTERVIACLPDDQIAVDSQGFYTIVVSTPAQRPQNARASCGVSWLAWGPTTQGLLIYRQMLAAPSFTRSINNIRAPGQEQQVMGDYYPASSYLQDRSQFEARGCPARSSTSSGQPGSGSPGTSGAQSATPSGGVEAGEGGTARRGGPGAPLALVGLAVLTGAGAVLARCIRVR